VTPHPLRDGRRVPIKTLMRKLRLEDYDHPAPLKAGEVRPQRVVVPLKQGAGLANEPLVKPGDRLSAGQPLGQIPAGKLGAVVHAPFAARVISVADCVVLETIV
jgi:Na+-translocating ferredoxin:NAD+ oxidoreductase RnfC subunit